jgi:ribosomal protein S18 acetylase RimI-like enzyme
MKRLSDPAVLERLLNQDWPWAGFALGDLEPEWMEHCEWWQVSDTVVLLFDGLTPRLCCAYGDTSGLAQILECLKGGRIWANIRPEAEDIFRRFYRPEKIVSMRRMYLNGPFPARTEAIRLDPTDQLAIEELLKQGEWVLFLPQALASGHFYGIRENDKLVAMAGTHLASARYNIAALGSVFTHPARRGKGLATICCKAVLASLSEAGISRAVLNVEEEKLGARHIYEKLGFQTACIYIDGQWARL